MCGERGGFTWRATSTKIVRSMLSAWLSPLSHVPTMTTIHDALGAERALTSHLRSMRFVCTLRSERCLSIVAVGGSRAFIDSSQCVRRVWKFSRRSPTDRGRAYTLQL